MAEHFSSRTIVPSWAWSAVIAAILVLALGLTWNSWSGPTAPEWVTVSNKSQENLVKRLPDGTQVELAAGAEMQYVAGLSGEERRLRFAGAGYFDVARDTLHPFVVEVGGALVRVLGTSFGLEEEDGVTVRVTEGSVRVTDEAQPNMQVVLKKDQQVRFRKADRVLESPQPLETNALYWSNRKLVYKGVNLADVFAELQELFDVSFSYQSPESQAAIARCRFTGRFEEEDIDSIVQLIAETMNLSLENDGKNYTIGGEGC